MLILNFFERAFRHLELMDRMMDALGVTERFKSLPGAGNVLRRASIRCRGCSQPNACAAMLDEHATLDEAPTYCRNHDLFERLQREIDAERSAA